MGLNISKGNMYDFVTHTWNVIKGQCYHNCSYCYMKRFGKQNPIRFDKKELKTNLGQNNYIFVGSSCDMWADNIPNEWLHLILDHCSKYHNTYLFQTKNPNNILYHPLPHSSIICATIETNRHYKDIMGNSPKPIDRAYALGVISSHAIHKTHITIEPIMDFDIEGLISMIEFIRPEQVNIGADSGRHNLPEPNSDKIHELVEKLTKITVVKQKSNLKRLL